MYPKAYVDFLYHFHCDRDYFECHEVLEEYWKEREAGSRELHWVGLIQIAVGLYHHRRGNFRGAKRMLGNAHRIIKAEAIEISKLALDTQKLLKLVEKQLELVQNHQSYESFNLPITDGDLLISCENDALSRKKVWGAASDLSNHSLIHRHTLRDRTEVIEERQKQLQLRKRWEVVKH